MMAARAVTLHKPMGRGGVSYWHADLKIVLAGPVFDRQKLTRWAVSLLANTRTDAEAVAQ
jgi:hypothetical protein